MTALGYIFLVLLIVGVLTGLAVAVLSAGDVKRYRRMRRM